MSGKLEKLNIEVISRQMSISLITGGKFPYDHIMTWLDRLFRTMDLEYVIDDSTMETIFKRKEKWIAHTDHRYDDAKMRLWFSIEFLASIEKKFNLPYSIGDLESLIHLFLTALVEGNPDDITYDIFRKEIVISHCYDLKYSLDISLKGLEK
jgi:hypothetical protein